MKLLWMFNDIINFSSSSLDQKQHYSTNPDMSMFMIVNMHYTVYKSDCFICSENEQYHCWVNVRSSRT